MTDPDIEYFDEGAFSIVKTRFGILCSYDKEGNGLISGIDKDAVVFWSRECLNGYQNSYASVTKTSFGDGYKL
jgi:hypothetical protein